MKKPKLSIVLPTHEMDDRDYFLRRCLDSLWNQTFQDFEIVVTDNSEDNLIEDMCRFYHTGIRYIRNPIKGMAQNTNEGIRQAKGDWIKILYMDDYLLHDEVLEMGMKKNYGKEWLIMGSSNNANPYWTDDIYTGHNKLGSPSALMVRNKEPLLFDEKLTWLLDCDLYERYHEKFGEPTIMFGKHIGIGEGLHQMSYIISDDRKAQEYEYLTLKHV